MKKFKDLVVAMVTPFHPDGSVNVEMEKKLVQHFIDSGVAGILVSGGTGEFPFMNLEERKTVIKTAAEVAKDTPVFILAGITCNTTSETVELAKYSGEVGADYVLVQPPHAAPVSHDGMVNYFKEIRDNTTCGLVLYHFPVETGITIDAEEIVEWGHEGLFKAVKNTASMEHTMELLLLNDNPDLSVSNGFDALAFSALACGCDSLINAGSNMTPKQYAEIVRLMKAGEYDKAMKIYRAILPLLLFQEQSGNTEPGLCKYVLKLQGYDCGTPRKPVEDISEESKVKAQELLKLAESVL